MIKVRLTLLVLAFAIFASSVAAKDERIKLLPGSDFAPLLLGCWSTEAYASLVDEEIHEVTRVCFETDRLVTRTQVFSSEKTQTYDAEGSYIIFDDRVHISKADMSENWHFGQQQLDCDAFVRSNQDLVLANCVSGDTQTPVGDFYFESVVQQ